VDILFNIGNILFNNAAIFNVLFGKLNQILNPLENNKHCPLEDHFIIILGKDKKYIYSIFKKKMKTTNKSSIGYNKNRIFWWI